MIRALLLYWLICLVIPETAIAADCSALSDQALSAFVQKQPDAEDRLSAAIEADCDEALLHLYLGALKRQNRTPDAAIAAFERGVKRHPTHQALGLELATTLALQGRLASALAQYDALLQKDKDAVLAQLGKARVLIWMERAKESIPIYREILRRDPRNLEAKRGMGAALTALLRRKEAEKLFVDVLRELPADEESLSALRMLKTVSTIELTLSAGVSGAPAQGISPLAGLRATVKVTPRLQLALAYQLDAPFLLGDSVQTSGYRQRADVAATLRIGSRLDLSVGYQLAVLPTTFRHGLPIELSIKLPRSLVLLLAARPAIDHLRTLSLLGSVGLQYHIRPELWIMLQGFRYDDSSGEHATVGVATIHLPLGKRCLFKLGGVYGQYREGDSYGGFAESYFLIHPRVDLGLFYQYAAGFLEQHTGALSLRWRY